MNKKRKRRRNLLSDEDKQRRNHIKDIRDTFKYIGFTRIQGISGKEIVFKERKTEFDDLYIYENLILIAEYTSQKKVSDHLTKKKVIYDLINQNHRDFIDFLNNDSDFREYKNYYTQKIRNKYATGDLTIRIIYCSINTIDTDHKKMLKDNKTVYFYDYNIVHYFKRLASTIKRSAKYELFDYLNINANQIGPNNYTEGGSHQFKGNILPVEKSSFQEGYNVVSFYIDADSLIRRAYVLRHESWRQIDGGFYQRMVDGKKITSMRRYLCTEKRVFINNIIATLSEEDVQLKDIDGNLLNIDDNGHFIGNDKHNAITPAQVIINDKPNIIGIIDGQHRVYAYHEGIDNYEETIALYRKKQNLLVTAVLFPKGLAISDRNKFAATLFKEINNTQTNIKSFLKQHIELMIAPFSTVAIAKDIIQALNDNGPLNNLLEIHSFDTGKIKTASIVSFALSPLIKYDNSCNSDSLYKIWDDPNKLNLNKDSCDYDLRTKYISFCVEKMAHLQSSVFKLSKDLIDSIHEEGIVAYTS